MATAADLEAAKPPNSAFSIRYSLYIAALLGLVSMLGFADRNVVAILLVPIQKDLQVSDSAMGALTGLSYTLIYATVALPMSRFADRGVRRTIIAAATAFWSVMTALCGAATGYGALLLARMGVAAGEAAARPAQMSMIGDLFSSTQRGMALGVVTIGSGLGVAAGGYVAAILNDAYNWRVAFIALGLPGIMVALAFFLTVREPPRGAHDGGDTEVGSFAQTCKYLLRIPTFFRLMLGDVFVQLGSAAMLAWMPTFMIRVHGMSTSEASIWFGLSIIPPFVGNVLAGVLSDRLARFGARWRLYMVAAMCILAIPSITVMVLTTDRTLMIAMMFCFALTLGPVSTIATVVGLEVVRPRARGAMTAVLGFGVSVIGGGLGPFLLGVLNDATAKNHGEQALRYTLLSIPCAIAVAAVLLLWTSRSADADHAKAQQRLSE